MKWELQLNNFKHDILNSKRSFSYSFRRIRTRDSQSSKNVAYFIISDIFQDTVLIKNSCFWKMKANCASVSPITIIRRISWAGLSVHKIYFYYHIFVRILFSSIIDASIKLVRSFPWEWNKKQKTKQTHRRRNVEFMDWSWKLGVLRNSRELGFLCDCIIGICSPKVLKNFFMMLLS